MKLYRLKDKTTGKFFASSSSYPENFTSWTNTGAFFRKIDTIRKHAENLCFDWDINFQRNPRATIRRKKSYHPSRMNNFIVIVNDVTFNGEEEIEATEIFKRKKK